MTSLAVSTLALHIKEIGIQSVLEPSCVSLALAVKEIERTRSICVTNGDDYVDSKDAAALLRASIKYHVSSVNLMLLNNVLESRSRAESTRTEKECKELIHTFEVLCGQKPNYYADQCTRLGTYLLDFPKDAKYLSMYRQLFRVAKCDDVVHLGYRIASEYLVIAQKLGSATALCALSRLFRVTGQPKKARDMFQKWICRTDNEGVQKFLKALKKKAPSDKFKKALQRIGLFIDDERIRSVLLHNHLCIENENQRCVECNQVAFGLEKIQCGHCLCMSCIRKLAFTSSTCPICDEVMIDVNALFLPN